MLIYLLQKRFPQNKEQMFMSQLLQIHPMRKRYSQLFQIKTLYIMVNQISINRLWIQLKAIWVLIKSEQELVC